MASGQGTTDNEPEERNRKGKSRATKRYRTLQVLAGALAAVVAVLLGYLVSANGGETAPKQAPAAEQPSPLDTLARRVPDDPLAKGRPDAPVVLIDYSDFRCPFCAKFSTDIEPELRKYVDSGDLRIEWRDYPIFGEESMAAAQAGRAAANQGKFWEFHDTTFSQAPDSGHPALPLPRLVELATQAGVPDIERFKADMRDPAVNAAIEADAQEGAELGVSSTPTFIVNGQPLLGAQPVDEFVQLIEQGKAAK